MSAPNAFQRRHALEAEKRNAQIARSTARSLCVNNRVEKRELERELDEVEMAVISADPGAAQRRDEIEERLQSLTAEWVRHQRTERAGDQLIELISAKETALYEEEFDAFVTEAEAATRGAESELRELRRQLARAASAWERAVRLWRPLNQPLQTRLAALCDEIGVYGDIPREAAVGPFPISLPLALTGAAPRPAGAFRLRAKQ